jgi:hypothetical protein
LRSGDSNETLLDWRVFCSVVAVAALLAYGVHVWLGLNFWVCFVLVVAAIKINGMIATI